MDLFAFRHQREAGERIGVLAADQHAEPSDLGVDDAQAAGVAVRPDELLVVGGHQLAMPVEHRAVRSDQEIGVPDAADARIGSLGEADGDMDAVQPRGHTDLVERTVADLLCLRDQRSKEMVVVDRRLQGSPDRKSRE